MDINITTPNLEQVLSKGNSNGDLEITSIDQRGKLTASSSLTSISYANGGVGEFSNIQLSNGDITIEQDTVINLNAPDVNTTGNITASVQVAAQNFKVNGTGGSGHIDLKHQSSDATSPASSTAIWANSSGDIKWKIDGNYKTTLATSQNTADRVYTFQNANGTLAFISDIPSLTPYLTIAAAAAAYEPKFTKNTAFNRNFGTSSGDILLQTGTVASKMLITDSSNKVTTATFSSGDVVLLDQPQTLTNKTISGYLTTSAAASTYEPIISSKGTAFNKNFGTSSGDILLQTGTTANQVLVTDANNKVTSQAKSTAFNRNFGASSGDILLQSGTVASRMLITDSSNQVTTTTFSSGDIVLLNQPQTLTGKTISGASNTFSSIPTSAITGYEGYALQGGCAAFSPADSATLYFGGIYGLTSTATAANRRTYFPKAGTIKVIELVYLVTGILGTSETFTTAIRINNTTDTTISASCTMDATVVKFSNTSLSIAVSEGDYFEFKISAPVWATNPTNVLANVTIYLE